MTAFVAAGGVCAPLDVTYRLATPPTRTVSPWSVRARKVNLADGPGERARLAALGAAVEGMRAGGRPPTVQVPYSLMDEIGVFRADRGRHPVRRPGEPGGVVSPPDTPVCRGEARWDERPQAEYVAEQLTVEFGTKWRVLPHGDHFHLRDTGHAPRSDG